MLGQRQLFNFNLVNMYPCSNRAIPTFYNARVLIDYPYQTLLKKQISNSTYSS